MNLELTDDQIDKVVVKALTQALAGFKSDLGAGNDVFVFGNNRNDDIMIKAYIECFTMAVDYYSDNIVVAEEEPPSFTGDDRQNDLVLNNDERSVVRRALYKYMLDGTANIRYNDRDPSIIAKLMPRLLGDI